jgi:hypothetical protein
VAIGNAIFGRLWWPGPTLLRRHRGEGRDLSLADGRTGEIPAFAGMTEKRVMTGKIVA